MTALRLVQQNDPPFTDIEMEIAVLGSILIDPRSVERLGLRLKPEHFSLDVNQMVYAAMLKLSDAGTPPDIALTYQELLQGDQKYFGQNGVHGFLTGLWRMENNSVYVDHYAKCVIDLAKKRRLSDIQRAIGNAGPDELDALQEELQDAMRESKEQTELVSLEGGLKAQNERLDRQLSGEKPPRWTGFHSLDQSMMRWEKGDLIIVSALTGAGKTAFALNVAYHLLTREKKRVCFFSLEMSDIQIADRLVGLDAGIPVEDIQDGRFGADDMQRFAISQGRLHSLPIRMSHDAAVTVQDIRRKIEKEHRLNPFDLIIVDYLGLMRGEGENRTQQVSNMVMGLKALAMDLEVPLLAPHQLNRGVGDSRPTSQDLKDSSTIEQSANTVILLHHDPEDENTVEVIVSKNRQRGKGSVALHWDGSLMKFSDIDYGRRGE